MTDKQPYEVMQSYGSFELRRYPQHLLAEVIIDSSFEDAGNRAFRYLFAYISGENQLRQKVAMTAPVVQADAAQQIPAQQIPMTSPVVQQSVEGDTDTAGQPRFRVAFVLPESFTAETAPEPTDARVRLRTVPESTAAAIRFSGRWSENSYQSHLEQLTAALAAAGLFAVGPPRFARFDPPYLPWFLRRNEVVLDVEQVTR